MTFTDESQSEMRSTLAELEAELASLGDPVVFGVRMLGHVWATCLGPRAKDEGKWLHPLPGVVVLRDEGRRLLDVKATEDVGDLVRAWRRAGVHDVPGARLAWTYCNGQER